MKKILSIIMILVLMLNVSLINVFAAENQKNINVFVDGSYIEEQRNISLKFRGSENQRIIDVKKSLDNKTVILLENI